MKPVLIAILLLLVSCSGMHTETVSGTVLDEQGNPLSDAKIILSSEFTIINPVGGETKVTETDAKGEFSIYTLYGDVHVTAVKEGYLPVEVKDPPRNVKITLTKGSSDDAKYRENLYYRYKALDTKNASFCEHIQQDQNNRLLKNKKWECIATIAKRTLNVDLCKDTPIDEDLYWFNSFERSQCVGPIARELNTPELCEQFPEVEEKCLAFYPETFEEAYTICPKIQTQRLKDACWYHPIAMHYWKKPPEGYCERIENERERNRCLT